MSIAQKRSSRSHRPRRLGFSAPAQARSRETIERFAQAAEDLLRTRPFETITVQDIVRHARRPVGSFYARFETKEALLPYLYRRYHEGLEGLVESRLARIRDTLGFERSVAALVDFMLGMYLERRWLIRTLALFARTRPEALPDDVVEQRRRVFDRAGEILLRHRARIAHADPAAAVRFGVFMVASVAREKLLFGEAPHARVTPIGRTALRDELVRALHAYLSAEAPR